MTEMQRQTAEYELGMLFQEFGVGGDAHFKNAMLDWCAQQVGYATGSRRNGSFRTNGFAAHGSLNGFTPERDD